MKKLSERAKKRIRIAKDVLLQLSEKKLIPKRIYVELRDESLTNLLPGTDLQKVFKRQACGVCAIGAVFVAKVRRYNSAVTKKGIWEGAKSRYILQEDIHSNLRKIFTEDQLYNMEKAYENRDRHLTNANRMRKIMKNIIKNGGTFRP